MARARDFSTLLAAALVICFALSAPYAHADSYARIVRLSDIDGDVQIDRNTGQGFEKAVPNLPITQGVRLQTGASGRAEVEFENGSALRLTSNTSVEFSQLLLRSSGDRVNDVRVKQGTVYIHYKHKGDAQFLVAFANRNFDLKKDANLRLQVNASDAQVAVMKGDVEIVGDANPAKVKKNETATLDLSEEGKYELAKGITSFGTDSWDSERTQYLDQYASSQRYGNSPYAYGYGDLYRYGAFTSAPGYGFVWVPSGMGFGFDPYSNGYWSYYAGTGYVFVSGYPWGWTPYRYGSWSYIPAVGGWAWVPGNWNRWNTGVAVVTPPPTWHHPTPPPIGNGGTVMVGQGFRPSRGGVPSIPAGQGFVPGTPGAVGMGNRVGPPPRIVTPPRAGSATPNSTGQSRPSRQSSPNPGAGAQQRASSPHIERSASPHPMGGSSPHMSGGASRPTPSPRPK